MQTVAQGRAHGPGRPRWSARDPGTLGCRVPECGRGGAAATCCSSRTATRSYPPATARACGARSGRRSTVAFSLRLQPRPRHLSGRVGRQPALAHLPAAARRPGPRDASRGASLPAPPVPQSPPARPPATLAPPSCVLHELGGARRARSPADALSSVAPHDSPASGLRRWAASRQPFLEDLDLVDKGHSWNGSASGLSAPRAPHPRGHPRRVPGRQVVTLPESVPRRRVDGAGAVGNTARNQLVLIGRKFGAVQRAHRAVVLRQLGKEAALM